LLNLAEKQMRAMLLDSEVNTDSSSINIISVVADKISCMASNVDIASHTCEVEFGENTIALRGRKAHEVFATIAEIGVSAEGAAGSIFEDITNLNCSIDVSEVKKKGGEGAFCRYDLND